MRNLWLEIGFAQLIILIVLQIPLVISESLRRSLLGKEDAKDPESQENPEAKDLKLCCGKKKPVKIIGGAATPINEIINNLLFINGWITIGRINVGRILTV